jgi:DNA-binding HxlR family transcriptional regulator
MSEKRLSASELDQALGHLFRVCADDRRLKVLQHLATRAATQKELRSDLGLGSSLVSRQMKVLEDAGLVARPRSHAPYNLTAPEETVRFLDVCSELSLTLATEQLAASVAWREEIWQIANPIEDPAGTTIF